MTRADGRCLHCGRAGVLARRGLCRRHYRDHAVRALYPAHARGFRGAKTWCGSNPRGATPDEPTGHPPGTVGKVRVMAERASRGLVLHHPLDAAGLDGVTVSDLAVVAITGRLPLPAVGTQRG